jgi:predicted nucleotidyltransferase
MRRVSREWLERLQDLENVEVDILGFALYADMTWILKAGEGDKEAEDQLNKIFGEGRWAFVKKGSKLVDPETGRKTVEINTDNCAVALRILELRKVSGRTL